MENTIITPGIYDLTNAQYHGDTSSVSKSGLDLTAKSPAHYYAGYLDPERKKRTETEAMKLGTMFHTAVLEPENMAHYAVFNDQKVIQEIGGGNPRLTNRYKEWKANYMAENEGKIFVPADDMDSVNRMADAIQNHPAARELITDLIVEKSIFWTDPVTGAPCKCRPDGVKSDGRIIIDLKTTEDASPDGFAKSVWNYRYHVQAPFYLDGFEAATGTAPDWFIFIAVEKSPPYNVGVYFAPPELIEMGREEYRRNLADYMEAKRTGTWKGYSDIIEPLRLPGWAFKKV